MTPQGLAPQGPAPPQANAPPPQDTADEANGFAELIAATLAAANEGGAASTKDVGTSQPAVALFDPTLALKQLLGADPPGLLTEEGSQQVAWPDRIAGAGAEEVLTTGTAGIATSVRASLIGVAATSADAPGTNLPSPGLPRPLTALPAAANGGAQSLTTVAQAGAQPPGVVPPPMAEAGVGTAATGGLEAAAGAPASSADGPNVLFGLSAPARTPGRGAPPVRPQQAAAPGEGAAAQQQAVRASDVAVLATSTVQHSEQAQARAAGLGGFASGPTAGPAAEPGAGPAQPQVAVTGGLTGGEPAANVAAVPPPAGATAGQAQAVQAVEASEAANVPPLASQLADTVARAVRVGPSEFRMQLHPPELGQVQIRIVETVDGVRVSVEATFREASELIQQHLPLLRSALEARDLRVGSLDVFHAGAADAREPGAESHPRGDQGEDESPQWSPLAGMEREAEPEPPVSAGRVVVGRVDVMA